MNKISNNYLRTGDDTRTINFSKWGDPYLIYTIVNKKSIELIYRQDDNITYTNIYDVNPPRIKIYKIIYSCKRGKWHESEKIEGQYISPQDETYEFQMANFIILLSRECGRLNRTIPVSGKSDEEVATMIKNLVYNKRKFIVVKI